MHVLAKNVLLVCSVMFVAGCATSGDGAAWQCKANGLLNAHYTGGDQAMIHLKGYGSGGSYKVTKNAQGTEVTGITADATPFTCVKLP